MNKPISSWLPHKATPEEIALIHRQLKFLASRCDGARANDGVGFNRLDYLRGHDLARLPRLTEAQAVEARSMLRKYRGQLEEMPEMEPPRRPSEFSNAAVQRTAGLQDSIVGLQENNERTKQLLIRGYQLVESALVHVSHGGPTREDGEAWAGEVRELLGEELGSCQSEAHPRVSGDAPGKRSATHKPSGPPASRGDEIQDMIFACEDSADLTQWEEDFISSIAEQYEQRGTLTGKQQEILERIYEEKG